MIDVEILHSYIPFPVLFEKNLIFNLIFNLNIKFFFSKFCDNSQN